MWKLIRMEITQGTKLPCDDCCHQNSSVMTGKQRWITMVDGQLSLISAIVMLDWDCPKCQGHNLNSFIDQILIM